MEHEAYTCHRDQTLGEVVELLNAKGTSSLIVVDENNKVVGFISDGDIMKAVSEKKARSIHDGGLSSLLMYDDETFESKVSALRSRNVMDLATTKVLCALPSKSIGRIADVLSKKRFKKVPIVDEEGILLGVVRRITVTRYIFNLLFCDSASTK